MKLIGVFTQSHTPGYEIRIAVGFISNYSTISLLFKVPEFRNFKTVPIRDKDIPDNVFQVFASFVM